MVDVSVRWRPGGASDRGVARPHEVPARLLALPGEPVLHGHRVDAAAGRGGVARLRALALGLPPWTDRHRAVPAGAAADARRRCPGRRPRPAPDHDGCPARVTRLLGGALPGHAWRRREPPPS